MPPSKSERMQWGGNREFTTGSFEVGMMPIKLPSDNKDKWSLGALLIWEFYWKSLEAFPMIWGNLGVGLMIHNLKRPYKPFIWILSFYRRNCSTKDWDLTIKPNRKQPAELQPYHVSFCLLHQGLFQISIFPKLLSILTSPALSTNEWASISQKK